jgi:hypothetical protein
MVHSFESEITQTNSHVFCIVNRCIVKMSPDSSSVWLSSFWITEVRQRPKHTIYEGCAIHLLPFQQNRDLVIVDSIDKDYEHRFGPKIGWSLNFIDVILGSDSHCLMIICLEEPQLIRCESKMKFGVKVLRECPEHPTRSFSPGGFFDRAQCIRHPSQMAAFHSHHFSQIVTDC